MSGLRLIPGLGALALAAGGIIDQAWRCRAGWDWGQVAHHEPLIIAAAVAGITLLVAAVAARERR